MPRNDPLKRLEERQLSMRGVRVGVRQLSALRTDAADDPTMVTFVLVHGLGVSSRYFERLARKLAAHGRVVVLDLPGFGGLPHPAEPLSIGDFAEVLVRGLARLGVVNPVMVGHSMGAQIVVEALATHPGLSDAAVLICPVVNAEERRVGVLTWRFLQSAVFERPSSALVSVRAYLRAGPRWFLEILPSMLRYPIEHRIARLTGEVVILRGTRDYTCPADWVQALAAAATGAHVRTAVIEGAAHQVVFDDADRVAQEALEVAGFGTAATV